MTANIKSWFTPKYFDEVHHAYQGDRNKLGDTVSGGGTFVGDKAYFPRMGAVDVYDSPEFARLILANVGQDFIELTAKPKFIAFGLWDPNAHKYTLNTAAEYGKAGAKAIIRGENQCIIDALKEAAANGVKKIGGAPGEVDQVHTIGDYDTVATLNDIANGIAHLGSQEAFEGEQVTCLLPFRNKMQFALDPYMASNDVKENMPWNDLSWRRNERTGGNADGTGVDLWLYAKSALVSGYNDKPTKIDERDGAALTDIIGEWFQAAAAARDAAGIVRIKSKANFVLSREPTPVSGLVAAA
ncbi:phage capsid protein [Brevundimonas olei]|uniref:Phage capsid protein n=1 Tax=Brevundimonas olei TaxID=657642 RepID=A0ABZ2ICN0_9CAUL